MNEQIKKPVEKSIQPRKISKPAENGGKTASPVVSNRKKAVKTATGKPVNASGMHAVREVNVISIKKKRADKKPFPWAVLFTAVILTAMFLFMMMNYAEVDKYRSEIADLDGKIASLQKTQDNLEVTLSNKYNLAEVKDYAENELGMVTKDKLSSHRISVVQDDRVEMHEYDDGEEGGGGFLLNGLGEVFKDFFSNKK